MKNFNAEQVLTFMIEFCPGLIDGEKDDASAADLIEHLSYFLRHLEAPLYKKLRSVAKEQRKLE